MARLKLFDEEEVLDKAMHLFWKKGYAETSMQDLVNTLQINRASMYDTYGNKEQLFIKAFNRYRKSRIQGAHCFVQQFSSAKEGITRLFENAINEIISDPEGKGCFIVNTVSSMMPCHVELRELLRKNQKEFENIFESTLRVGQVAGEVNPKENVEVLSAYLYTFYSGIMVIAKNNSDEAYLRNLLEVGLLPLQAC